MPYVYYNSEDWIKTKTAGITEQQINEGRAIYVRKEVYQKIEPKLDRANKGWSYSSGTLYRRRDFFQTLKWLSGSALKVFWRITSAVSHIWWLIITLAALSGLLIPSVRNALFKLFNQ